MVSPIVEYIAWLMFPKYNFIKLFPIFLVQNIILKKKIQEIENAFNDSYK